MSGEDGRRGLVAKTGWGRGGATGVGDDVGGGGWLQWGAGLGGLGGGDGDRQWHGIV